MATTFTANDVDGQLPTTKGTLYTCPSSTKTYVKSIVCHNTNAADQTVVLYKKKSGGTSRIIARVVLAQHETLYFDDHLVLDAAGIIEGETTTSTAVDYNVSYVEEA